MRCVEQASVDKETAVLTNGHQTKPVVHQNYEEVLNEN